MQLITARYGQESHTSTWGKFVIVGLLFAAEARLRTKHETYSDAAATVDNGTIFTVWQAKGERGHTTAADFWICLAQDDGPHNRQEGGHSKGNCFVEGKYTILAHGHGPTYAPRLLDWWVNWAPGNGGQTEPMAYHLAYWLNQRGRKTPGPM